MDLPWFEWFPGLCMLLAGVHGVLCAAFRHKKAGRLRECRRALGAEGLGWSVSSSAQCVGEARKVFRRRCPVVAESAWRCDGRASTSAACCQVEARVPSETPGFTPGSNARRAWDTCDGPSARPGRWRSYLAESASAARRMAPHVQWGDRMEGVPVATRLCQILFRSPARVAASQAERPGMGIPQTPSILWPGEKRA